MQQLHLVGFTTDLEGLIFSARRGSKSGSFVVGLDEDLLAMVEEALRLRGEELDEDGEADDDDGHHPASGLPRRRAPKPESGLSPREIQARLRGGRTIAEVAREAGVDEEWVTRFADPILAEQAQVVGRARSMVFTKPRLGESAQDLLTSVLWNLADRGMSLTEAEFEGGWSAYHARESTWVVRFTYVSRRRSQVAEWEVDLGEDELHARNRLASDLGYVEPGRRRRRVTFAPEEEPVEVGAPSRSVTKRPSARPAAKKKATSAKAAGKKAIGKKATAAKKSAAGKRAAGKRSAPAKKSAAGKKATGKKAPAGKKVAAKRTVAQKAAAGKRAAVKRATPAGKPGGAGPRNRSSGARAATRAQPAKKAAKRVASATSPPTESRTTVGRAPAVMPSPTPAGGRRPPPRGAVSRASIIPQPVASTTRTVVPQPAVSRSTAAPFTPQPSPTRTAYRPAPEPGAARAPRPEPRPAPAPSPRQQARVTESFPRPAASEPVRTDRPVRASRPAADDKPRVVFDDVAGVVEGDTRPVVRIRADQAGPSAGDARQPRRRRIRPNRG